MLLVLIISYYNKCYCIIYYHVIEITTFINIMISFNNYYAIIKINNYLTLRIEYLYLKQLKTIV